MIYLLQVSTCWILFYSIYAVFLKKETFFSVNRYYLLGALFTGLVIPLIGQLLPANSASTEVYGAMYAVTLPTVEPMAAEQSPLFTWTRAFWLAYGLGAAVVASRMLHGLHRIWHIYQSGERTQKDGYTLVQSTVRHLPFSFFNCIFISKSVRLKGDIEHVLRHEELHVNQWHSLDTLLLELLHVFFWFNPILIFYKRAIKQSHEYLADAYVTGIHEKYSYGQLLLGQSTSGLEIALANQFFNSQIKKRIKMMYKERSKKQAMVKYFAIVPVLLIALFIFSSNTNAKTVDIDRKAIEREVTEYFAEASEFNSMEIIGLLTQLDEKYVDSEAVIRSAIHAHSPFMGKDFTVSKNDDKGGCIHFEDEAFYDEDGNPISAAEKNAYGELFDDFQNDMSSHLSSRVYTQDGSLCIAMGATIERYITAGLSKRVIENRIAQEGMRIKFIDDKVHTLLFEKPLSQSSNVGQLVVNLLPQQTLLNGENIAEHSKLKEKLKALLPTDTEGFPVRIVASPRVRSNRVIQVLDICATLGVKAILEEAIVETQTDTVPVHLPEDWKPASKFTFPEGMGTFRVQLKGNQGVVVKSDKMVYKQGVDYTLDRKKGTISLMELSAIGRDEILTVYVFDDYVSDDVVTLVGYGEPADDTDVQSEPIIMIDGKQVERSQYEKLDPNDIASVSVLKGEAAVAKYGEKGQKGIIEIELKTEQNTATEPDNQIYKVVEEMPRFPGCEDNEGTPKEIEDCGKHEMLKYIYTNIKYPAEARDKGVEGMVVVQFVVNKDGSVTGANVVRDIGGGTAPEVIRIVESMPKWIPGRQNGEVVNVLYTLPVRFKLESEEEGEEEAAEPLKAIDTNYGLGQEVAPLYLLDGKRIDKAEIADIDGVIVGIHVLKAEESLRKYGDAAKEGAVEITTKTKQAYDQEEYTELLKLNGPIVYPQPNDGNFRVYFKTESSSPVTINIYGASGNAIKVFDGIIPEQGTVEQQVELGAFTGGSAFLSIIQDGKIYTEKLILQK